MNNATFARKEITDSNVKIVELATVKAGEVDKIIQSTKNNTKPPTSDGNL